MNSASANIDEVVRSLSAEEQESVLAFISYLKQRETSGPSRFVSAAEEFISEHPELLRRLAQ